MKIERKTFLLRSGKQAVWEYDHGGDLVEIIFQPGAATGAVELTDSIILRFDWKKNQPLSLSIMSASHILQPGEHGEIYFELLTSEWPPEIHDKVMLMLKSPPLSELLKFGSYAPAHTRALVPLTSIQQTAWMMQPV